MSDITLGLDIGSNSIGWALLDTEGEKVVDCGVRIFPEGVDRDTKGAEISKCANRREARSARRNRWRKAMRKDKLVRLLQRNDLLPQSDIEILDLMNVDPYLLRAKGLKEKLSRHEIGRAIFHLNQRRGFWSNRKSTTKSEDGIVKKKATELDNKIQEANCQTLGEYLASLDRDENRIRGWYTFRSMYEYEFDKLWEKQIEYDSDLTSETGCEIKNTIFFQRPLKPCDDLIGDCELENGHKHCPKASYYARRFRILQDVNNLKIHNPDGTELELTNDQRQIILDELWSKKEAKFSALRKKLDMFETQLFNLEEGSADKKEPKLKGDEFNSQLKNILKKQFTELSTADIIEINEIVIDNNFSDEKVIEILVNQHSFSLEQAEKAVDISLPSKYANHSVLALQKLLPYMEKGMLVHQAKEAVYGKPESKKENTKSVNKLPSPDDLRNPIVNRALVEMRKVVNTILREYGKPDSIYVEMAREIKSSKEQRKKIHFDNENNRKENEKAREELIKMKITKPSRDDIIKYKLWIECGTKCPYTGKMISQNALFGTQPEFQIEHIIPYSRSLDDSCMNKTLCDVHENIKKGNKTPYEYYAESKPQEFEQILQRIKVLPYHKRKKFWQKEVELDSFIQRQLNDTRYINKKTVEYLKMLGIPVIGTRGQATSELRHQWGLNNILDYTGAGLKNRDDHRHHAIDAAVTAVTRNKHLQALAGSKYVPAGEKGLEFGPPWEKFREQLEEKVNQINVSHRVSRKVSGQLHEETSYGLTGIKDSKGQDVFVYKKPLETLTIAMVNKIVDPVVKQIIIDRLSEFDVDPEKKGSIPKETWKEPLYMKSKKGKGPLIKKVRIRDVFNNMIFINDENGKPYRAVAPGNNHHIEIFEYKDKKGQVKRDAKVVTLYEAMSRLRKKEPVICRDYGDDKVFICSLAQNEMVMMEMEDGTYSLHRIQKLIQDGRIVLRPHTFAGKVSESDKPPLIQRKNYNTLKGYKVSVDPIGRIFPAND